MKTPYLFTLLLVSLVVTTYPQKTENVFLVTLDGLRWQELFYGADSLLVAHTVKPILKPILGFGATGGNCQK